MKKLSSLTGATPLTQHRATPRSDYANYADKVGLRTALIRDQCGLCCYCMTRVKANEATMKIEHWRCQSRHPDSDLSYSNLLAACLGGHGQPESMQHCDTRKGERDLKFNPADAEHRIEKHVRFDEDDTIASNDKEFNRQLNEVLNFNLQLLKNRRKGVLNGILQWWKSERAKLMGPVPDKQLLRERSRREGGSASQLAPNDPVAVWWLNRRLNRKTK